MPRPHPHSPTRRFLMQGAMWLILGATVGLAELVTYYHRAMFQVALGNATSYRGVSVKLPGKWAIVRNPNENLPLLLTATENQHDDKSDAGPRTIRVVHEPLASYRSPLEFALSRLTPGGPNSAVMHGQTYLPINGAAGEAIYQIRESLTDAPRGRFLQQQPSLEKTLCAATVDSAGRGLAIELEGTGEIRDADIDLIKQIAGTLKVTDEPPTTTGGEISLGENMLLRMPDGFCTARQDDPLVTSRTLRSQSKDGAMRLISFVPIVMSPTDGGATLLTQLSLSDQDFENATTQQLPDGTWRIDPDADVQKVLPVRAFATARNGAGLIATFRGGQDDAWIASAWKDVLSKLTLPEKSSVADLTAAGEQVVRRFAQTGISPLIPQSTTELWFMQYHGSADHPMGWWHYVPGEAGGRFEQRIQFENQRHEIHYEWRGRPDLKTYRAASSYSIFDSRDPGAGKRDIQSMTAILKDGKISINTRGNGAAHTPTLPDNYIPGGWLPVILAGLTDQPIMLRTDSFVDYSYAQSNDLLTLIIRPERDASRSNGTDNAPLRCVSVEVSGSGERSRWFYRADGTLDGIDYQQAQHLDRSSQGSVETGF